MSVYKKILFISHHEDVELGLMKKFFIDNEFKIDILKPLQGSPLPLETDEYIGIIILGGAMNVGDSKEYPEIEKELYWIKNLLKKNISMIGICLGAQLIAKASGANVQNHKNNMVEIGYKDISILRKNTIFHEFPEKVYHWHKQGINLPKNAVHLAYNSTFDVQAYSIGKKIFGFQFHPEVVENMILNWNKKSSHMLTKVGAENIEKQLNDHKKYSNIVKKWFENFLKNWLDLNY